MFCFSYFLLFLSDAIPRHKCNFRSLFYYIYITVKFVICLNKTWWRLVLASRNIVTNVFSRYLISLCSTVILTIIYYFISFDWSRSFWSDFEKGWSYTVFPVVLYLNFIEFTRFLTDSLYLLKLQQNLNMSETIDHNLPNVYLLSL